MEVDGKLLTESDTIIAALEALFPDHNPLLPPADSDAARRVDSLRRLERRLFGDWLRWLTSSWCAAAQSAALPAQCRRTESDRLADISISSRRSLA